MNILLAIFLLGSTVCFAQEAKVVNDRYIVTKTEEVDYGTLEDNQAEIADRKKLLGIHENELQGYKNMYEELIKEDKQYISEREAVIGVKTVGVNWSAMESVDAYYNWSDTKKIEP